MSGNKTPSNIYPPPHSAAPGHSEHSTQPGAGAGAGACIGDDRPAANVPRQISQYPSEDHLVPMNTDSNDTLMVRGSVHDHASEGWVVPRMGDHEQYAAIHTASREMSIINLKTLGKVKAADQLWLNESGQLYITDSMSQRVYRLYKQIRIDDCLPVIEAAVKAGVHELNKRFDACPHTLLQAPIYTTLLFARQGLQNIIIKYSSQRQRTVDIQVENLVSLINGAFSRVHRYFRQTSEYWATAHMS